MSKKIVSVLLLASVIALCAAGYCQDSSDEQNTRQLNGTVSAIDWVVDKLVVRKSNDVGEADEITFVVPDYTPVTKGGNDYSLANINIGDKVTIEYHNSFAGLKVTSITVKQ
jgi:hypothetical protein